MFRTGTMRPDAVTPSWQGRDQDLLDEIAALAWAVGMHCQVVERYAALGYVLGIDLACKDARACLVALLEVRKGLSDERG
jgi:hypothetical protein